MRGISFGRWRPTWIILDDAERTERARNPDHREALAEWFAEVVEHLGDHYTNIDVIGTLLHPDALPARLMRRPDVHGAKYASILAESRATDLWDEWRRNLHDLSDPHRMRTARRFFEQRRETMLENAEVLWPEKEDYYALQVMRETRGHAAFNKEKQNDPELAGGGVFRRSRLRWFRLEAGRLVAGPGPWGIAEDDGADGEGWSGGEKRAAQADAPAKQAEPAEPPALSELRLFGFLDPALGGEEGDFAAVATVGLDILGYLYVLEVWLARATPS